MALLETHGLTRRFDELVAVDHVDLAVEAGEFRSVIGPNGAGKTTLFNCITGALRASEGEVVFDGEDVTDLPSYERVRRGIGRSFQITNVFGGLTALENVRLAAQSIPSREMSQGAQLFRPKTEFDDVNAHAQEVLEQVGLADVAEEEASTLAYGDQRRLEIGLVLATDPEVVLLDEPTAGMGSEETAATMALVDDVLAEQTLLLIEHDIDLVMDVSDRITVLNRGSIVRTGTPEEVANDEDVQAAYLGGHGQ
ncbi:ABC transporter ATP-binding protein [Halorubellus sp. JP-L1]|uniref:ABC transporter ATP-binding protein n=1 Tax=Halorubellus sp. JP-L1 TaxID=2715753 RepID=UPI001407362E|nr:ABC transporter ATP-binding protein [Halorubellus sp. JP-L1]NHN40853.1 ABC transporter ATP-binding protein [Halorubellus sp. JP-L1]